MIDLAERFGYSSPLEMCKVIQEFNGWKLGTIDIVPGGIL
jgi:hypothetical protein